MPIAHSKQGTSFLPRQSVVTCEGAARVSEIFKIMYRRMYFVCIVNESFIVNSLLRSKCKFHLLPFMTGLLK